ncbi:MULTISPECIES: nuclear transport factor 2 family protein [Pseudomonas]|uniref:nuclear transport factor 2 family protein n=1 Tax=Pseudomonadaceae TaxID=135621 RepID=UPI001267D075|nr:MULTISPECIES: nuclear transport factor 2 family protein [Pseudomonas]
MNNLKDLAGKYFNAFSSRDINGVRESLAANVVLRDWEISRQGIDDVLAATASIFASSRTIDVVVVALYLDGSTVSAELEISFDGGAPLLVMDVLEFDAVGKILSIRAFKG